MGIVSIAFALTAGLVACGETVGPDASSADGADVATEAPAVEAAGLEGSPWVTSIVQGNLPTEAPKVTDDLYTHFDYAWLAEHQERPAREIEVYAAEIPAAITGIIQDTSKTDHELEQLRILYNQAADLDALREIGLSEVEPYLERIDAVGTLSEMDALLTSDDFPFSPFIVAPLATSDLRADYTVNVLPNLMFSDPLLVGGMFYQDSDSDEQRAANDYGLDTVAQFSMVDLSSTGMPQDEIAPAIAALKDAERTYAKFADYPGKYLKAGFGAEAKAMSEGTLTLDEMCELCPNFPLEGTLARLGKAGSSTYLTQPAWLSAFNEFWAEDNLETIKQIVRVKVLQETRPYRDQSILFELLGKTDPEANAAESAYNACNSLDTFAQVMAKHYVSDVLGAQARDRIGAMTDALIGKYRELVFETGWVGDETREKIIEKLDHMNRNILEPEGGYFDYGALELTPTEDGGTLLGNYLKLKQYRLDRESELVGTPAHANAVWNSIAPTTTNAFHETTSNSINIYPGYVSSLVYSADMTDADLCAALGTTIGHEISHAFDFTGAQYGAYGQLEPVLTDEDVEAFTAKCDEVAGYYGSMEVADGMLVDGRNVVGEATADLAGMQAAVALAKEDEGFDYERFCRVYAHVWARVVEPELLPVVLMDTHPLDNLRVNVCSQMCDETYEELGVAEGDAMWVAPEDRISIWGPNA